MHTKILGIGLSVPQHVMTQSDACELAEATVAGSDQQQRLLKVLYRRAGVDKRHTALPHRIALDWLADGQLTADAGGAPSVVATRGPTTRERMEFYEEHAIPLAIEASETALERSDCEPQSITHLVTVSCTGFFAPGVDIALIKRLGLPASTQRVHVGFMGCHGVLNGLRVAQGLAAQPKARVLLCAVELCSLHYHFLWDPERFLGNALFADGAAAIVIGQESNDEGWQLQDTGSMLLADTEEEMSWRVADHGFEMTLTPLVPTAIREQLAPFLRDWLGSRGLKIEDIAHWVIHPGGPRILAAVEEALGLSSEQSQASHDVLREFGNMSSPTVIFILDRLMQTQATGPCVVMGFGPGLVAEVALLERAATPSKFQI